MQVWQHRLFSPTSAYVQGEVDNDVDLLTEEENELEPQPPVPLRRAFECISELRSFFLVNGLDDYSLEVIEQQVVMSVAAECDKTSNEKKKNFRLFLVTCLRSNFSCMYLKSWPSS